MNNENNPHLLMIALGSLTADGTLPAGLLPKKSVIMALYIQSALAIAASDTNYAVVNLKSSDGTLIGSVSTKLTGGNGALVPNVALLGQVIPGQEIQDAGTSLLAQYDETDAGSNVALSNAQLIVQYYPA